jgi:hypothetical protein
MYLVGTNIMFSYSVCLNLWSSFLMGWGSISEQEFPRETCVDLGRFCAFFAVISSTITNDHQYEAFQKTTKKFWIEMPLNAMKVFLGDQPWQCGMNFQHFRELSENQEKGQNIVGDINTKSVCLSVIQVQRSVVIFLIYRGAPKNVYTL